MASVLEAPQACVSLLHKGKVSFEINNVLATGIEMVFEFQF